MMRIMIITKNDEQIRMKTLVFVFFCVGFVAVARLRVGRYVNL